MKRNETSDVCKDGPCQWAMCRCNCHRQDAMTERNETPTEQTRDDIVKRLRRAVLASSDDAREAADTISTLRSTVATLTEQLREARESAAHARQFYGRRIDALERLMRTNGAITPNEFWSILGNGFEDARKDSPENVLLREISTLRHDLGRAEFARDAALAENARLREENDALRECVSDSGGNFEAWKAWHSPGPRALSNPPKGE